MGDAWTMLSHVITGFVVFGAAGWAIDRLTGGHWALLIGLLVGGTAAFALIYIRFVYEPLASSAPADDEATSERKELG